jgi:hypothetical protein
LDNSLINIFRQRTRPVLVSLRDLHLATAQDLVGGLGIQNRFSTQKVEIACLLRASPFVND